MHIPLLFTHLPERHYTTIKSTNHPMLIGVIGTYLNY